MGGKTGGGMGGRGGACTIGVGVGDSVCDVGAGVGVGAAMHPSPLATSQYPDVHSPLSEQQSFRLRPPQEPVQTQDAVHEGVELSAQIHVLPEQYGEQVGVGEFGCI